ncbi:MAG: hypothetical protein QNK20_01760 [Aureibaculum sp.]|nr:hypothetical protein [Aureibaculum sp.]
MKDLLLNYRKLSLLLVLSVSSITLYSQLFLTINPADGFYNGGVVGNANISKKVGIYGNLSYGSIDFTDDFGSFSVNQFKYGAGLSLKIKHDVIIMAGLSNSLFYKQKNTTQLIDMSRYKNNSVNVGGFVQLPTKRNINLLLLIDIVNWESQIGIGIGLNKIKE